MRKIRAKLVNLRSLIDISQEKLRLVQRLRHVPEKIVSVMRRLR